jgi:cation transport ATPase
MPYKYSLILSLVLLSLNSFGYARSINFKNKVNQAYQSVFEMQLIISQSKPIDGQQSKNKKNPPLIERKRQHKKKKRKLKKKKVFHKLKHKNNALGVSTFFSVAGLIIKCLGAIAFAIGAILFNPLIWMIALGAFLLGLVLIWSSIFSSDVEPGIFFLVEILLGIAGVALLIVGLTLGIMSLWIGGLVFLLGLMVLLSIFLFFAIRLGG